MQRPFLTALALAAALGAGCASTYSPRYQRAADSRDIGYYDTQVSENRFIVQYRSDRDDPRLAEDFAFRRAAELTLDHGYDWFQVISRSRAMTDEAFGRYDTYRLYGDDYRTRPTYRDSYGESYGPYDDNLVVIEIIAGYTPAPHAASVYDARRVLDNLRGGY